MCNQEVVWAAGTHSDDLDVAPMHLLRQISELTVSAEAKTHM